MGVRLGDKKAESRLGTALLDWALTDFSGYGAVEAWDDGPCGVRSAVANRRDKRLLYEGVDHNPRPEDRRALLRRLPAALEARDVTRFGVTPDGSPLYPEPLREVFGAVPPHLGELHVLTAVVQALLTAVASARKSLAAQQPQLPKGRPRTRVAQAAARKQKRLAQPGAALFTPRPLFVQPPLSQSARKRFWRLTRGLPQRRRVREIRAQVDALCDRRCRTQTALAKLAPLRRRLHRCTSLGETLKKLFAPTLEKALTLLDDT